MSVTEGSLAPDFTLPTDGGGTVTLSALRGRPVVIYFYPKDDTPGCTMESCGFRDALPDFSGLDATVIGISRDDVASHDRFKAKYALTFPLAADVDGRVCEAYGSWVQKSMYGRLYMGIDRSTFLIDENGVLRKIWRGVKVGGHVAEVLAELQRMKGVPVAPPSVSPPSQGPLAVAAQPKKKAPAKKKAAAKRRPPKKKAAAKRKPAKKKAKKAARRKTVAKRKKSAKRKPARRKAAPKRKKTSKRKATRKRR